MKMSSSTASFLSPKPLIPLTSRAIHEHNYPSKFAIFTRPSSPAKIRCSQNQQQLNLSVLRFTLGIPGLDESYLPRYIGYGFGALLALNQFLEDRGLRTFSCIVFCGCSVSWKIPQGSYSNFSKEYSFEQIFAMSQNISAGLKENLAWGTYVLLRNTNSISVLISVEDALCVRGYWSMPKDLSRESIPHWFQKQTQGIGLSKLKDAVYLDQSADSELKQMVPEGTRSLLVQPILEAPRLSTSQTEKKRKGFVLLASGIDYAFTDKDKAWIAAIANKFTGTVPSSYS